MGKLFLCVTTNPFCWENTWLSSACHWKHLLSIFWAEAQMISLHRMTDGKASCVRTPLIHLCIQVALLGMMHSQSGRHLHWLEPRNGSQWNYECQRPSPIMFNLKSRSGLFQMNMPGQPTRTVLFKRLFCIYTYFTNKFKDLPLKATEKSLHTYIWINYVTKAFKLGPKYTVLGVLNFWGYFGLHFFSSHQSYSYSLPFSFSNWCFFKKKKLTILPSDNTNEQQWPAWSNIPKVTILTYITWQ